jgi:hypothetical protein
MELSKTLNLAVGLLALALFAIISCSGAENGDKLSSESTSATTEAASKAPSPDPAFDPLLGTLRRTTTAPIMLPATLPPELKDVAIASGATKDDSPPNDDWPTTHGDKYAILFLNPNAFRSPGAAPSKPPKPRKKIVLPYVPAYVVGTLAAEPASTPPEDYSRDGVKVTQLGNVDLPSGTIADLKRVGPTVGDMPPPFSVGTFEEGAYRYTLKIEIVPRSATFSVETPDGDLARQTLSTMVKVPRSKN